MCRLGATSYDAAYSWGSYEGTLREIVHCFKFRSMRPLAGSLARYLSDALPLDERFDAIVPMPLHWRRWLERGFNQCEAMAAGLAKRTGLPVWKAVRRIRDTPSQAELTSAQRRRNVARAFVVTDKSRIAGKRLLLLDDVLTTGATANACAAALKDGGAARVVVLTVARVDRRSLREFDAGLNMISVGQENARP